MSLDADVSPVDGPGQRTYPPLRETSRGRFEVTDTISERLEGPSGSTRTAMHIGGAPHRRAHAHLAGLLAEDGMSGGRDIEAEMRNLSGQEVAVLTQGHSGTVEAQEGTMLSNGALLNKGSSSKGRYIFGRESVPRVLGYRKGYGKAEELAAEYRSYEEKVPALELARFDDIPLRGDGDEPPSEIGTVFVIDHPGFDGAQDGRGCVFFATDRDPENVVNGYLIAHPGSGLGSEHGSFTTGQLSQWGARVKDFAAGSITFRDAMRLGDKADAYGDADMGQPGTLSGCGRRRSALCGRIGPRMWSPTRHQGAS